jgi:endonuclease III
VKPPALIEVVATLKRHLRIAPVPTDPFQLILWENIGYLIDDEKRRTLFDAFAATVGLEPAAIAAADEAVLLPLAKRGGMRPETRVERWRTIARLIAERCGGDLAASLRALPLAKARALLKAFPMIGDPGADRVLLLSGLAARPCLESNGLRSLARLGFFKEQASYNASYKAAIAALVSQGLADAAWLTDAHLLLREHGKTLCRRGVPLCVACPLEPVCSKAPVDAL